ncbi:MAG: patatin-like phospholipase family protein [Candidatus Berkiellales bacterium]
MIAAEKQRPKIGLVLSGGGARGAAHIGVIETLEEMNVPIDFIVGTSMGSVIGGLYASGVPIAKIKHDFSTLNWKEIFSYNIKRTHLYYRRKLDSDIFVIKNFISFSDGSIHIPYGIITGQSLYEVFNSYLLAQEPIRDFDHLPIRFKAVSTDLVTGKPVVLEEGDLALALLASMAVPGIISPIDVGDYLLVDGGVSANLPVQVAKSMGADVLIVVNVSTPMSTKEQIDDLSAVLGQLTNILTDKNVKESKSVLGPQDIYIQPDLNDIGTSDFQLFSQGIQPGKEAALKKASELKKYAINSNHPPLKTQKDQLHIDKVDIQGEGKISPKIYHAYLDFHSHTVAPETVKNRIDHLYGLDIFDRIYYGVEDDQNEKILKVHPKLEKGDPVYLQATLLINTDFQTTNDFGLIVGLTNPRVNALLGEWRILGRIGQGEGLLAEFYQPLTPNLTWFINPVVSIQRTTATLYQDFNPLATYLVTEDKIGFAFGNNFANVGRLLAYWEYLDDDFKRKIGNPLLPEGHVHNGEVGITLEWDAIDNLYFPHHGLKGNVTLSCNDKSFGSDNHFSQLIVDNLAAVSAGKHSFVIGSRYDRTLDGTPSFPSKYTLGGLFRLTGLTDDELFGNNAAFINGIYFYNIKNINLIPNRPVPVYIGASLEAGKVWGQPNVTNNRFFEGGSIFVGLDTILGPIYLAAGITDNGRKAIHLSLRPPFKFR